MKKSLKIVIYSLSVIIILTVAACSANPKLSKSDSYEYTLEEAPAGEAKEIIYEAAKADYEFEKDQLSVLALKAFEQRAMQKVTDFADYLSIISDKSLDSIFKNQASEMLVSLFYHEKVDITVHYPKVNYLKQEGLKDFLSFLQNENTPKLKINVSGFIVEDSLIYISNKRYSGEISCIFSVQNQGKGEAILPDGTYKTSFDIESRKTDKQFGADQKQIWEIFLSDISLTGQ